MNNVFRSFLYSIVYKSTFSPKKPVFLSNPRTLSDSNKKNEGMFKRLIV